MSAHFLNTDDGQVYNATEVFAKQNYPNPFNPTTDISFSLDQASDVNLTIFNLLGQKVRVLVNGTKNVGIHTMTWNGQMIWAMLLQQAYISISLQMVQRP